MSYEQAMIEAYASRPDNELALDTLEFHHSAFIDDDGLPTAIRVVQGFENYNLKLEDTAPLNPNEYVKFTGLPFTFTQPSFEEDQVPSCTFSIANISREITKYLELAGGKTENIKMYYRPYLLSDLSKPQLDPVYIMTLTSVRSSVTQVTGTASLSDVHNWPFPSKKYTPSRFPGLVRP